jgi:hypothetical protein
MRRTYISPELKYDGVPGTVDMKTKSSFYATNMMSIPSELVVTDENLTWYQTPSGEQIDPSTDTIYPVSTLNMPITKVSSHSLLRKVPGTYVIRLDSERLLREYLYGQLRKARTFEGLLNTSTRSESVELSIYEYIDFNLLTKYRLSSVDLYLNYVDIVGQSFKKLNNLYAGQTDVTTGRVASQPVDVQAPKNLLTRKSLSTIKELGKYEVEFKQERPEDSFCFDYSFNVTFVK